MGFFSSIRNAFARSSVSTLTAPKLYVEGLSKWTTHEKLQEAFAPFGNVVEAKIIADGKSGISKGFGFVTYETIEEAEKARKMDAQCLDGWVIHVEPIETMKPRPQLQPPPSETDFEQQEPQPSETFQVQLDCWMVPVTSFIKFSHLL